MRISDWSSDVCSSDLFSALASGDSHRHDGIGPLRAIDLQIRGAAIGAEAQRCLHPMALVFVVEQPPSGFVVVTVIQLAGVAVVGAIGETCLAFGVEHKMRAPYRRRGVLVAAAVRKGGG